MRFETLLICATRSCGLTLFGVSVDALYQKENGAVNLRSSFDDVPNPLPSPGLAAYISNDDAWNLMGKYTFDFAAASCAEPRKLR